MRFVTRFYGLLFAVQNILYFLFNKKCNFHDGLYFKAFSLNIYDCLMKNVILQIKKISDAPAIANKIRLLHFYM